MGVRLVTSFSDIDSFFKEAFKIIKSEIFLALSKLGEECVRKVRDRDQSESWIDRTANLRSSIGYAVYDYGVKQIESAFNIVKGGSAGSAEGKKMVAELAREYANCYALVVVAAMNYADKVEAIESKDVLASTELWAKSECNARLEKAKEVAIKKINAIAI